MDIAHVSNTDIVLVLTLAAVFVVLLYKLLPGEGHQPELVVESFSDSEIKSYDPHLPKYAIASLIALAVGTLHASIKSFPPFFDWLAAGGYGGHLFRDIANSHLIIVVGGTVAATGLTWYALPRIARRPLWSETLASSSFWLTVLGAGGFYLTNVIAGLVIADMHHATGYEGRLGVWRAAPLAVSATIMGLGYWTFVLNVLATIWQSRRVSAPKPQQHLLKFLAVGALGLLAGTVQGVIQVMPAQERWIHAAGPAGEFIDPIAHAHVNLVTGLFTLIAGLLFFFAGEVHRSRRSKAMEEAVFWVLVPSSIAFYLSFLGLGLIEGTQVVSHGLTPEQAEAKLGLLASLPLSVSGTAMLLGMWMFIGVLIYRFTRGAERNLQGSLFILAAACFLLVGTLQGVVQTTPWVRHWIEQAGQFGDGVANAHAQLNMLGGVMLALIGLMLMRPREFLNLDHSFELARRTVPIMAAGVFVYYLAATVTSVQLGSFVADNASVQQALARSGWTGPLGMSIGAGLLSVGAWRISITVWQATQGYRCRTWHAFWTGLMAYNSSSAGVLSHIPLWRFIAAEFLFAIAGFPGVGWLMSGRALIGLPLVLINPPIAWGLMPMLTGVHNSPLNLVIYLSVVALSSSFALTATLLEARSKGTPAKEPAVV